MLIPQMWAERPLTQIMVNSNQALFVYIGAGQWLSPLKKMELKRSALSQFLKPFLYGKTLGWGILQARLLQKQDLAVKKVSPGTMGTEHAWEQMALGSGLQLNCQVKVGQIPRNRNLSELEYQSGPRLQNGDRLVSRRLCKCILKTHWYTN